MAPCSPSSSSCLVIGGAGNLGSQLVALLLERNYNGVATFDLRPYSGHRADEVASFTGDITDPTAIQNAMQQTRATIVFHTASIIDLRPIPSPRMHEVNVIGTKCVLAAARSSPCVKALIYTSSIEVVSGRDEYGAVIALSGTTEDAGYPAHHHLPYAATKAEAEKIVLEADGAGRRTDTEDGHPSETGPLFTCSIRPGYIMGAGCIGQTLDLRAAWQSRGG